MLVPLIPGDFLRQIISTTSPCNSSHVCRGAWAVHDTRKFISVLVFSKAVNTGENPEKWATPAQSFSTIFRWLSAYHAKIAKCRYNAYWNTSWMYQSTRISIFSWKVWAHAKLLDLLISRSFLRISLPAACCGHNSLAWWHAQGAWPLQLRSAVCNCLTFASTTICAVWYIAKVAIPF